MYYTSYILIPIIYVKNVVRSMNENVILFLALDEKALKVLGECLGPHMIECQILCKLFKLGIVMSHD